MLRICKPEINGFIRIKLLIGNFQVLTGTFSKTLLSSYILEDAILTSIKFLLYAVVTIAARRDSNCKAYSEQ